MKNHNVNFTAYEVTETDGYNTHCVAYFSSSSDANKCASLEKGYRSVSQVTISKSWTVYDSFDEYDPKIKKQKREELLLRLTPEERGLLGV